MIEHEIYTREVFKMPGVSITRTDDEFCLCMDGCVSNVAGFYFTAPQAESLLRVLEAALDD